MQWARQGCIKKEFCSFTSHGGPSSSASHHHQKVTNTSIEVSHLQYQLEWRNLNAGRHLLSLYFALPLPTSLS